MNNALRITLIVFGLVVIVVIAGNTVKKFYEGKILDFQTKVNEFEQKIADIDKVIEQSEQKRILLEEIKNEAKKFNKYALNYDSPPVTFDYLLNIVNKIKRNIDFNFNYSGQSTKGNFIENSYLIKGTTKISNVYKLISHLEKQQPLYYIHNLAFSAPEMTVSDTITYSFMLTSISKKIQPEKVDIKLKSIDYKKNIYDLFVCNLILNQMAVNEKRNKRNESLFNPQGATLIAVTYNEAFFRDAKGIFQVIKVGDPVFDGFLKNINHIDGSVTFKFDNGEKKYEKSYYINNREMK